MKVVLESFNIQQKSQNCKFMQKSFASAKQFISKVV